VCVCIVCPSSPRCVGAARRDETKERWLSTQLSLRGDSHRHPVASLGREGGPSPVWSPVGWLWGCPVGDSGRKGDGELDTIGILCPGLATLCSNPCPDTRPASGTCRGVFSLLLRTLQRPRVCKAPGEAGREENLASPPPSHLPLSLSF